MIQSQTLVHRFPTQMTRNVDAERILRSSRRASSEYLHLTANPEHPITCADSVEGVRQNFVLRHGERSVNLFYW
jgi:hypothetical protein